MANCLEYVNKDYYYYYYFIIIIEAIPTDAKTFFGLKILLFLFINFFQIFILAIPQTL